MSARVAIVFLIVFAVLVPEVSRADLNQPSPIPIGLSARATVSLTQRRTDLVRQLDGLAGDIAQQRTRCGHVADNDGAKIAECEQSRAKIQKSIDVYKIALAAYEQALVTAAREPLVERNWPPLQSFVLQAVNIVQGEAYFVLRDGRRINARNASGVAIDNGATLFLGPNASLKVLLPDETIFTIQGTRDGGSVVFDEFTYNPETSASALTANVARGIFRLVTAKLVSQDPEHMKIKVPVGSLGPRGTDVEAAVEADGSGFIKLRSGSANLTPRDGSPLILLQSGQMVSFSASGVITGPQLIN
jgi:hypothetical protein